jgi:hypothetical protein
MVANQMDSRRIKIVAIYAERGQRASTATTYEEALRKGRWRAIKSQVLRRCKDQLREQTPLHVGVEMIPIERIVGSAGRGQDFDLAFSPRSQATRERWIRVAEAVQTGIHLPPIRVLRAGDAYFVEDGNHRVSVASMAGDEFILADVYELSAAELEPNESCSRLGYSI